MSQECPERRHRSGKVAEAVDALYALRDQMDTDYTELIQPGQCAATELLEHVKEHGATPDYSNFCLTNFRPADLLSQKSAADYIRQPRWNRKHSDWCWQYLTATRFTSGENDTEKNRAGLKNARPICLNESHDETRVLREVTLTNLKPLMEQAVRSDNSQEPDSCAKRRGDYPENRSADRIHFTLLYGYVHASATSAYDRLSFTRSSA
jgi:hypothetical protein